MGGSSFQLECDKINQLEITAAGHERLTNGKTAFALSERLACSASLGRTVESSSPVGAEFVSFNDGWYNLKDARQP